MAMVLVGISVGCLMGRFRAPQPCRKTVRERPPGLLQHVLIVLVFWSCVLPLTQLPPSSQSLRLCLWASILLCGPVNIAWICCARSSPTTPVQKQDAQHMLLQHRGAHAETAPLKRRIKRSMRERKSQPECIASQR